MHPSHEPTADLRAPVPRERCAPELRQLLRAVEQSPVCIVITDLAGSIEYVNPRFESVTGYAAAEVIGQNPRILKSGDQTPEFYRDLWATITQGREWRGEFHNRKKSGELFWAHACVSPVTDESGQITHFIGIAEDVTERRRIEQQNLLFAALAENTGEICVLKDLSRNVLAINEAGARRLGGRAPSEFIGRTIDAVCGIAAESETALASADAERRATDLRPGETLEREENVWYADGTSHTHLTRYFPVHDAAGSTVAIGYISIDISARKAAETQLILAKDAAEAASRAKSSFLATMSHELRTPLNAINGVAALLSEQELGPENLRYVELIQESGQSLLTIIEEVLLFSGLQAGKAKLEAREFRLLDIVWRAVTMVAPSVEAKGLVLSYWIDRALPALVVGDPMRLQQALVNLLANAVKFTDRGRIHLGVRARAGAAGMASLVFYIVDTGIGISADGMAKLFQPFTQSDDSITRRFGGSGLGLAITRSLITLMGGEIRVRSLAGRGTAFRVTVTLPSPDPARSGLAEIAPVGLAGRRALAIARDPAFRAALREMFAAWGATPVLDREESALADDASGCAAAVVTIANDLAYRRVRRKIPAVLVAAAGCHPTPNSRTVVRTAPAGPADIASGLTQLFAPRHVPAAASIEGRKRIADRIPLRVLVVDDIPTNRETARLIFHHLGYHPETATNGAEALAALECSWFDLIMLDVQMPVMDGLTAAKEVCRRFPDVRKRPKMVALTASALPGDRERCLGAGMDECLSKPVLPKQMEACIQELFGARHGAPASHLAAVLQPTLALAQPWVDVAHHAAITDGMPADTRRQMLYDLHRTFKADFQRLHPILAHACAARNGREAADVVHGLKGGALMLGWPRMAARCTTLVQQLRAEAPDSWETIPAEVQDLFTTSSALMSDVLQADASAESQHSNVNASAS